MICYIEEKNKDSISGHYSSCWLKTVRKQTIFVWRATQSRN